MPRIPLNHIVIFAKGQEIDKSSSSADTRTSVREGAMTRSFSISRGYYVYRRRGRVRENVRRSRMHGTFQVSACPPRVRASKSAVCTRVSSLRGHAHVRVSWREACQKERKREKESEGKRERERERDREDGGRWRKDRLCPREDQPLEARPEEKLAALRLYSPSLSDFIPTRPFQPQRADRHREKLDRLL